MLRRAAYQRTQFARLFSPRNASTYQRRPFRPSRLQVVGGLSAAGLLIVGATGALLNTGTHMWLENRLARMKTDVDSDNRQWEWDLESERWTGDPSQGGTDSGLGSQGRKAVRDAWFSQNRPEVYGTTEGTEEAGDVNIVDAVLLRTEVCLRTAITIAEQPDIAPMLHPCTLVDLLTRRAATLERLGPAHVNESRMLYERVWNLLDGKGIHAARIAVKLGDLNQRLGEGQNALAWWARAIQLSCGGEPNSAVPVVPTTPPTSPLAQRTLVSALVSVSAFYAMARQLSQAQGVEEASLNLLRTIRPPESLASASLPQALHFLSLLHRSAIFSLHLSEVLYAQRVPVAECLQRLQTAATSSERVAYALVGMSIWNSDNVATPSAGEPLLPEYENACLEKPATTLLRDARRSAADAWNLMGELTERMGPSHNRLALSYYQRAIGWAGRTNEEGALEAAPETLRDDWTVLWRNYARMRQAVEPTKLK
ncbi:hypothetical protein B0H10DRAFT_1983115 [Mycena sp. CBHHK59/15]|nr:hypothetical protein B0H10DRAFT_1983115 [Mycena sp. CBHHK59/15]